MSGFSSQAGSKILYDMIHAIQENKQYLSDIDGQIGDGDHGINMNKGFTLTEEQLQGDPGDLAHGLMTLSKVLMTRIGGSMGPLYGMFFRSMAKACKEESDIDAAVFGRMIDGAIDGIAGISKAKPGDKTMIDTLIPAQAAYHEALLENKPFKTCLAEMSRAAGEGCDATKEMVAKLGRSSRLGERSRGVIDAGAASCCIILQSMATTATGLLDQ